jgi:hypothetical protein
MTKEPNCAEYLHQVLSKALSTTNGNGFNCMSAALGVQSGDVEFFRAAARLHYVLDEIGVRLALIDGPDGNHMGMYRDVERGLRAAIQFDPSEDWNQQRGRIREVDLMALRSFAGFIARYDGAEEVPDETLMDLRGKLENLEKNILESDLSAVLKSALLEQTRIMRQAIDDYFFRGNQGLRRAAEQAMGAAVFHQEEIKASSDKKPIKEFFEIISYVNVAVTTATKVKALAEPLVKPLVTWLLGS